MPILQLYVDDDTLRGLREAALETGRQVDELAESAISEAVVTFRRGRPKPPGYTQYTVHRP